MTNRELENKLEKLARTEREMTNEILHLINLADQRKIYIERGYASLFDWLTRAYNYSESAASRRIRAARLLHAIPEVAEKIATGNVNLSTLAKAQSLIQWQERSSGDKMTSEVKSHIIEKIENKSQIDVERTLYQLFPEVAQEARFERKTVISDSVTKLSLCMSYDSLKNLERARDILSHKLPQATLTDVIVYLVNNFLDKKDPLRHKQIGSEASSKTLATIAREKNGKATNDRSESENKNVSFHTTAATKQRVKLQTAIRSVVFKRAHGTCEYTDPASGQRCESAYQLEIDHIFPVALGGTNTIENLRCLCRKHNNFVAKEIFQLQGPPISKNKTQIWSTLLTPNKRT